MIFINSLNSEGIAEQLQQKLEEVEARILAANERRQQRLNGIGNRLRDINFSISRSESAEITENAKRTQRKPTRCVS